MVVKVFDGSWGIFLVAGQKRPMQGALCQGAATPNGAPNAGRPASGASAGKYENTSTTIKSDGSWGIWW